MPSGFNIVVKYKNGKTRTHAASIGNANDSHDEQWMRDFYTKNSRGEVDTNRLNTFFPGSVEIVSITPATGVPAPMTAAANGTLPRGPLPPVQTEPAPDPASES